MKVQSSLTYFSVLSVYREFYSKERSRMQEQLSRLDDDLRLTRSALRKELDWKEKMDKNYQQLMLDKRQLLGQ